MDERPSHSSTHLPAPEQAAVEGCCQSFSAGSGMRPIFITGHPMASAASSSSELLLSPHALPDHFSAQHSPFSQHAIIKPDLNKLHNQCAHYQQHAEQHMQTQHHLRRVMRLPSIPAFADPAHFDATTTAPTLYATPAELSMLEPRAGSSRPSYPPFQINLSVGMGSLNCDPQHIHQRGSTAPQHRRVITSPVDVWDMEGAVLSRQSMPVPLRVSTASAADVAHAPLFLSVNGSLHAGGAQSAPPCAGTGSGPCSASNSGNSAGLGPIPSAMTTSPSGSTGTPQALMVDPSKILPVTGSTATAVNRMLAELPPELQPMVLAKVAVKGKGGRQPAADPRDIHPNMDPRKVRRILANRQSAAKSKLKTRVLLETLKANKEVLSEKQGCVQAELQRLQQLVQNLETQNRELMHKLALVEQTQLLQYQQQQLGGSTPVDTATSAGAAGSGSHVAAPQSQPQQSFCFEADHVHCNVWPLTHTGKLESPQILDLPQLAADPEEMTEPTEMMTDNVKSWFTDDLAN